MKQTLIIILAAVGILVGAVVLGGNNDDDTLPVESNTNLQYGNAEAAVTLSEYGDFECPSCALYFPTIRQLKEEVKDHVSVVYKHFPLPQIHQNAIAAHKAAQAAANQGKFWEMHDLLYEQQTVWNGRASNDPTALFEGFATQLELDLEQYQADIAASETTRLINADISEGKSLGVSGTPTFFINGERLDLENITNPAVNPAQAVEDMKNALYDAVEAETGERPEPRTDESSQEDTGGAEENVVQ